MLYLCCTKFLLSLFQRKNKDNNFLYGIVYKSCSSQKEKH